ncbi:molybdopterin-dependent oxidoreductase [Limibacillus halophilus]|uniref:Oxidoreductase molybdopterin-binding domain-containing protein n=1 Tax=Limibacillus halophilus TaxID=1579333 RepID=A0A839SUN4_9PROT|nr:molybdopterin-dependent oxidoreductase [Limibacillus halophilus]MBB3066501.1 hypothetical protein [Limibacillus halophilus]
MSSFPIAVLQRRRASKSPALAFAFLPLIAFLAVAAFTVSASAEQVLLEISTDESGDNLRRYDRADLAALEQQTIRTSTAWTDGVKVFKGPLVRDLLTAEEEQAFETVEAVAANDYRVSIPMSDFVSYDVILATEMDGQELTLRDKGPLWIVYPRDDYTDLNQSAVDARWVWQLVRLEMN